MKTLRLTGKCRLAAVALVSLLAIAAAGSASAQGIGSAQYYGVNSSSGYDRTMGSEFSFVLRQFTAPELTVNNIFIPGYGTNNAVMRIKDSLTYGIGYGYNINPRLNINADLSYGSADYDANWGTYKINGSADMWTGNLNLDFNLLDRAFTPFVSGGVGFLSIDSNVPSGVDVYYWWDYWWGYQSTAVVQTHSSTELTWNASVGLRWDITRAFFAKASYTMLWAKLGASGTELFPQYTLNVGLKW